MKHLLLIGIIAGFFSCKKEDPSSTARITYTITESSPDVPVYTATYTETGSGTQSVGGLTGNSWSSPVVELKRGAFVSFNLQSSSASGDFRMSVYVNGVLWESKTAANPNCNFTISGNLP
jgi:hypothetical protein